MMLNQQQNMAVQPIDSLTPFIGTRWWIKARVTDKSDIRTWNKPTSSGKLFSFTLVDESSSIRATVFQEAVDMFFPILNNGSVYYLSGGQVKNANKKFSNVNNDYEISFDKEAQIQVSRDANNNAIPVQRYNFVPISLLKQRETGSLVDVLCVVLGVGEASAIVQKATGKSLQKKTIKIADSTASIDLTLWEDNIPAFKYPVGSVLAIRQLRIGSFDGVTLSTTQQTQFEVNPNIPDVRKLNDWFTSTGGTDVPSLSNQGTFSADGGGETFRGRRFLDDIQTENMGKGAKADFFDCRCVPVSIKADSQWYDACPNCNKKVTAVNANVFKCEKCDKEVKPNARYLISMMITDNVSQVWVTLFNEAGTEFFGMPADQLKAMAEKDNMYLTRLAQQKVHRPYLMRIRVKEEKGPTGAADEERLKCTVTRVTDFLSNTTATCKELQKECDELVKSIELYS